MVIWSFSLFVVAAVAVAAWLVFRDVSPSDVATTGEHQSPGSVPSPAAGPTASEVTSDSVASPARLEIPEPEFNFGFVPQKAKVSHVFWLHSAGTDTLRILKVNPG